MKDKLLINAGKYPGESSNFAVMEATCELTKPTKPCCQHSANRKS